MKGSYTMPEGRKIIHIDMDAFYASVEQLDHPDLAGKAVIVGGNPQKRGVVSAASYEARKYGVHSAMPMAQAIRRCPHAVVLPVRMERYAELSRRIRDILQTFTPAIEPLSLDEAFLDVTESVKIFGSAAQIGQEIKLRIKRQLRLIASVGIAPNKFLAKLASDLNKPDGFMIITEDNKQQILDPLPVSRIWGVGKVTEKALKARGITTIRQLRGSSEEVLQGLFGNQTPHILQLAQGIDHREVEPDREAKSISSEQTFIEDISDKEFLLSVLLGQVEEVAQRLRADDWEAKTISLKLRYEDFRTMTRSVTLDPPTNITAILWQKAQDLLIQWHKQSAGPLRLLGFRASGLQKSGTGQQLLFAEPEQQKQQQLDKAVDEIRNKYGRDVLQRGSREYQDRFPGDK